MRAVVLVLLLGACQGEEVDGDRTRDSGWIVRDCFPEFMPTSPQAGDEDAYIRAPIEGTAMDYGASARIELSDAEGTAVAGRTEFDRGVVRFLPDSPLRPSSRYDVRYGDECIEDLTYSFTTSSLGSSPLPTCDLLAGPYALDLDAARFTAPTGLGEILAGALEHAPLLQVVATGPSQLDVLWAWTEGDGQDTCQATAGPFPATTWAAPWFDLPARKLLLRVGEGVAVIEDVAFEATFAPDCTWLGGGVLTATLDVRQQLDWAGPALEVSTADEACDALTGFGLVCQPCADAEDYCLDVRVDHIQGEQVPGGALPITEADILADPACAAP